MDHNNPIKAYQSILAIVVGFSLIALWLNVPNLHYASLVIGVISLASKKLTSYIVFAWNKLAEGLGWVTSKILLTIIFYVFLFPLSLAAKLARKDPLMLNRKENSTFKERNHQYSKKDLVNIW